jgi:uncharacterized protein DUF4148
MNKISISLALAAGVLGAPVLAFAQADGAVTRAEVRADLVSVEKAGYNPSIGDGDNYPADVKVAEAKVSAGQDKQPPSSQAYGGVAQGSASSGMRKHAAMRSACVGPVSFCNVYFGS